MFSLDDWLYPSFGAVILRLGALVDVIIPSRRADLAGAVIRILLHVCCEPEKMREEISRTTKTSLASLRVSIEVGILTIIYTSRVFALDSFLVVHVVHIILEVLPQDITFWELRQYVVAVCQGKQLFQR